MLQENIDIGIEDQSSIFDLADKDIYRKRTLALADAIDKMEYQPDKRKALTINEEPWFAMNRLIWPCGTPACIAGHAAAMSGSDEMSARIAAQYLGLSEEELQALFVPVHSHACYLDRPGEPGFISPQHAAAVLRHLADTGEIDWTVGKS